MKDLSELFSGAKDHIFTMLAPMAGVTDMSYRSICHEMGADLTVTEMISAKAVTYGNKNTLALCRLADEEHPVSLQIFGSEPETMAECVKILQEKIPYDIIDINMGCPMPKIVNNGEGSALMKDPLLVGRIVSAVAAASSRAVSVKIRSGYHEINAPEIAHAAEESGASLVTVHARRADQYYEGRADWDVIRHVKERVKVPVIGNGDVTGIESAKALMTETGCDGVAVGRASRGNPWIFREISEGSPCTPTAPEKKDMMIRHLHMCVAEKGEYTGVREMRKHIGWYTAGMPGSAKLRVLINRAESSEEMEGLIATL